MQIVCILAILFGGSSWGAGVGELCEDLFLKGVEIEQCLFGRRMILAEHLHNEFVLNVLWIDSLKQAKENSQVSHDEVRGREVNLIDVVWIEL